MRPCALPIVSVRTRSGGGDHAPEGGIVAEGERDVGLERRLVVLDGEEVGAATVADDPADLLLGKDGVAGDHATRQRQRLEQLKGGGDLVAVRCVSCNWPITPPRASLKAASRCT